MLTEYMERAMRKAHYKLMENGRFSGPFRSARVCGRKARPWKNAAKNYAARWKIGFCSDYNWDILCLSSIKSI